MGVTFYNIFDINDSVFIIGDFTNWKPVDISSKYCHFDISNEIPYLYKYIVNGVLQCSTCELTIVNSDGNLYNYIIKSDIYDHMSIIIENPYSLHRLALKARAKNNYELFEKYNMLAANKGYTFAMHSLATYYLKYNLYDDVIYYSKMALRYKSGIAIYNLAILYYNHKNITDLHKLCHNNNYDKMAIANAMALLAKYHLNCNNDINKSNKYMQKALANDSILAMMHYAQHSTHSKKEQYYLQAINKGYTSAMYELGIIYLHKGLTNEALIYLQMAADKNHKESICLMTVYASTNELKNLYQIKLNNYINSNNDITLFVNNNW